MKDEIPALKMFSYDGRDAGGGRDENSWWILIIMLLARSFMRKGQEVVIWQLRSDTDMVTAVRDGCRVKNPQEAAYRWGPLILGLLTGDVPVQGETYDPMKNPRGSK